MGKDVIAVEAIPGGAGWRLLLTFEGGERRVIDIDKIVKPIGVFAGLKDPAVFRAVRVNSELGTIVWPTGADLCPDVLYEQSSAATAGAA